MRAQHIDLHVMPLEIICSEYVTCAPQNYYYIASPTLYPAWQHLTHRFITALCHYLIHELSQATCDTTRVELVLRCLGVSCNVCHAMGCDEMRCHAMGCDGM